jgi:hypothetical protein
LPTDDPPPDSALQAAAMAAIAKSVRVRMGRSCRATRALVNPAGRTVFGVDSTSRCNFP